MNSYLQTADFFSLQLINRPIKLSNIIETFPAIFFVRATVQNKKLEALVMMCCREKQLVLTSEKLETGFLSLINWQ